MYDVHCPGWDAGVGPRPGKLGVGGGTEVHLRHRCGRPDPQQDEAVHVRQEEQQEGEEVCHEHRGLDGGSQGQGNICEEAAILLIWIRECNFLCLGIVALKLKRIVSSIFL